MYTQIPNIILETTRLLDVTQEKDSKKYLFLIKEIDYISKACFLGRIFFRKTVNHFHKILFYNPKLESLQNHLQFQLLLQMYLLMREINNKNRNSQLEMFDNLLIYLLFLFQCLLYHVNVY